MFSLTNIIQNIEIDLRWKLMSDDAFLAWHEARYEAAREIQPARLSWYHQLGASLRWWVKSDPFLRALTNPMPTCRQCGTKTDYLLFPGCTSCMGQECAECKVWFASKHLLYDLNREGTSVIRLCTTCINI